MVMWMVICASPTSGQEISSPLRGRDAPAPNVERGQFYESIFA